MTSISEAADNAADYISELGHRKYDTGRPGISACIRGALAWSNGVPDILAFRNEDDKTCVAVHDYLGLPDTPWGKWKAVEDWNNTPERTQQEVIDVLRDVATKYRSDAMEQRG